MSKHDLTKFYIILNNFITCVHCINSSNISSKALLYFDFITKTYFENETLLLIHWTNASVDFQEELIKYCVSSEIITMETCNCDRPNRNVHEKPSKNIVILLGDFEKSLIKMAADCPSWNGRAKILILVSGDERDVREAISEIWAKTKSANIAIMLITNSTIKFFKYYPYNNQKIEEIDKISNFFDNKIPKNFNGSILHVAVTDSVPYVLKPDKELEYKEGLEVRIINIISQKLNFRVKYKESPKGENPWINRSPDGRIIGLFGLLARGEADILFHGVRIRDDRTAIGDATAIHTFDELVWVYPKKIRTREWGSLFYIFRVELWGCIALNFILITSTVYFLRKIENETNFGDCWILIIARLLNNTTKDVSTNNSYRIFMFTVFLFALNITSAYQSYLIMSLASPKSEQVYQTIKDAVDGNLIAYLYPSGKSKYNKTDHDLWNRILSPGRHIWTDNYTDSLNITAYKKTNYGEYILNLAEFEVNSKYLNKEGKPIIHIEKKFREPYWVCLFTSRWHPLTQLLTIQILRLFEFGFNDYFMRDINQKYRMKGYAGEEMRKGPRPLSLKNLQGAFILVFLLLMVSTFVFGCELLYKKITGVKIRIVTRFF